MINRTFSSFSVLSRELEPKFDNFYQDYIHGRAVASGISEMFYPMMTKFAPDLGLDFVFYYESDACPLRPGWLEQIERYSFGPDSDFWFLGSQQRHNKSFGGRIHGYMHGNSVVRVQSSCARNFLKRVYSEFRHLPWDSSVMRYLMHKRNLRESQHVLNRIRFTELIGHFGQTKLKREDLLKRYPEMYMVHGRGYFDSIASIMGSGTVGGRW
jgi:hypothetical protein